MTHRLKPLARITATTALLTVLVGCTGIERGDRLLVVDASEPMTLAESAAPADTWRPYGAPARGPVPRADVPAHVPARPSNTGLATPKDPSLRPDLRQAHAFPAPGQRDIQVRVSDPEIVTRLGGPDVVPGVAANPIAVISPWADHNVLSGDRDAFDRAVRGAAETGYGRSTTPTGITVEARGMAERGTCSRIDVILSRAGTSTIGSANACGG